MKIVVSDELLKGIDLTPGQALLDFAVGVYSESKATLGRAARIAGMSQPEFLKELGKRRVPIHYTVDDLKSDLLVVREQDK
jgi:predicted HTH domain antitoxin